MRAWERGRPPQRVRFAHRQHVRCAKSRSHRKAIGRFWAKRRAAFNAHRREKLAERNKWGTCRHDAPAGSQAVLDCIHGAAVHHGADEGWMVRVASCESGLNRLAKNGSSTASGLFQFLYPSTWATTPYASKDVWSAKWNALAAAWMASRGRQNEWVCSG